MSLPYLDALLLQAVQDAVIVTLPSGEIIRWNRAAERIYGWSAGELLGRNISEVTVPAESAEQAGEIMERLRNGEPWTGEFLVRRRDGGNFWARVSDSPVVDDAGNLVAIIGVSQDISDERRAAAALAASQRELEVLLAQSQAVQDELRRSNSVKDEFLALVSHELRTPLTVITGLADALAAGRPGPDDDAWTGSLQELKVYAHRLREMIENLLVLARVEHGEVNLEPVLLQRLFGAGLIGLPTVRWEVPDDLPSVNANPGWAERIVSNLVENAIKYSGCPDDVVVRCTHNEGNVEVHVLDRGPGVAPDERELIFEPFYRGTAMRSRAPGVGVGLAVCQRLATLQKGRMGVKPRAGGGSDFFFSIPTLDGGDA